MWEPDISRPVEIPIMEEFCEPIEFLLGLCYEDEAVSEHFRRYSFVIFQDAFSYKLQSMIENLDVSGIHRVELPHNFELRIVSTDFVEIDLHLQNEIEQVDQFEASSSQLKTLQIANGYLRQPSTFPIQIKISRQFLEILRIVIDKVCLDPLMLTLTF